MLGKVIFIGLLFSGALGEPEWLTKLKQKTPQCLPAIQDRIYGGKTAELNEFPSIALIEYTKPNNEKGYHCQGSLINERYVLTAALCVEKIPATWELTSVRLGEWNITSEIDCSPDDLTFCAPPPLDIRVVNKIVHPNYRKGTRTQHYDIALLRLARKVKFTDFVEPICLPLDQKLWETAFTGESFTASGWGKTEKENKSPVIMKVDVPHVSNEGCSLVYGAQGREIKDHQICAGGVKGKDTCVGDSGGPLMAMTNDHIPSMYLAGIVSYGPAECGLENVPAVYTRVSSYLEWISDTIQDEDEPGN